ncbi:MAG: hypothetical protein A2636_06295 [Elusimicrobia bacterium RIFCSPHIGHO2_01_FULL_64_10]|nr:MAG: hypothetical protein A2636_06295 [Elusimicrobia bacterium RIFCSPHIGHO2_01_FULL_64_10]
MPAKNLRGLFFWFEPDTSRHLSRVLRKKRDDTVQIFDGRGLVRVARITDDSDPDRLQGEILGRDPEPRPADAPKVRLYPALLKGPRFEWLLEKAVELGVESIRPVVTDRVVVKLGADRAGAKASRWKKIVIAAAQQCGRAAVPEVFPPASLRSALNDSDLDCPGLLLWESESRQSLSQVLQKPAFASGRTIRLFVGPEGGFTMAEARMVQSTGAQPASLGGSILRAETAAIAALARIVLA